MTDSGEAYDINPRSFSIFISYRHKEGSHAGRLYDRLLQRFDAEDIFYDQSGIESGEHFPTEIKDALDSARVVLVVIGPDWLSAENLRRLNDEKDFVRREILQALLRKEHETDTAPRVVPVLVGGALQPAESELPEALGPIAFLQSHSICGNFDDYNRQVESLCELISRDSPNWVAKYSHWLQRQFADRDLSYANFGQDISVLNPDSHFIQRKAANTAMDDWWAGWREHHKPFVLLGEEGDGKSWAFAFWLANKVSDPDFDIPVIYVPAFRFCVTDRKGVEDAIIDALERTVNTVLKQKWQDRLRFLLQSSDGNKPLFMLVVDGLNERPSLDWRAFFDGILASPFQGTMAVMVTCRSVYWKEHLASAFIARTASWTLPPFNDSELDGALARLNYTRNDFSTKVLELVAKPRYFDLAIRLREQLEDAGDDITIERLIYEDWRDLTSRKRGIKAPMPHDEFLGLITDLVERYGDRISVGELGHELASYGDEAAIKTELLTTGILTQKAGKLVVSKKPLILGLGLLLANEIEEVGETESKEIEEVIAVHMEPHSDMDRKVQIKAMALCHALLTEEYPEMGRLALFRSWAHGRNLDEADMERICAYLPLRPTTYFSMAVELWKGGYDNRQAQDLFMVSFLRYGHIERVRAEMIPAFERWLGFVHPLGYRGLLERDETKKAELIEFVEKRLGHQIVLGNQNCHGCHIEFVADQNLLRLAQVAESVISHLDREPFLQALCNGAMATAVMGGSMVDYRWVVRIASGNIQQLLLEKSRELIAIGQETALRAADYLLFWLCSEEAIALRESIPEELSFRSLKKKLFEKDRCNSAIYLWDEDNYHDYLQRTQLAPIAIAENLREVAINPQIVLQEELSARIDTAVQQIDLTQIGSNIGQTREDIDLRDIEPAICAYKPGRYAELIRNLTLQLDGRDDFARRMLALELYKHLPILTDVEREILVNAWRLSLAGDSDEAGHAESTLFPMVVFDRPPNEQISFLRERKNKTGYFSNREPQLREIIPTHCTQITEALDDNDGVSPEQRYALLWSLSKTLSTLNDQLRERLFKLFMGDNSIIRYLCLEIFFNTNDKLSAQKVFDSGWRAFGDGQCDFENRWGSILLARFVKEIPYSVLSDRISPQWLGYAIQQRGNRSDEIADYALRLHVLWTRIANPTDSVEAVLRHVIISMADGRNSFEESVSVDLGIGSSVKMVNYTWGGTAGMASEEALNISFDPKVAEEEFIKVQRQVIELFEAEKKRGNHWIDTSFSNGNLDAVIASGSQYWREWINPVLAGGIEGRRLLAFSQGLYESLCATLLNHEPEIGIELFRAIMKHKTSRYVSSATDIEHLLFSLFEANESPPVNALMESHLNNCNSDKALSEIAYIAQSCDKTGWFDRAIQFWISSELDYDKARALRLLGFSIEERHGVQLQAWMNQHGRSWLMDVARDAQKCSNRNSWARIWVERFVAEGDRVKSWAAFRLFLRCVDKRFWIWRNELINVAELPDWKKDAYRANIGTIIEAIKKNEEKLKDTFISHEIKENQLWPWMKKYAS